MFALISLHENQYSESTDAARNAANFLDFFLHFAGAAAEEGADETESGLVPELLRAEM